MAISNPTANSGWVLPTVGGSTDAWGTILNTVLGDTGTGVDAVVQAVSVVANAALPKAGGTMTGQVLAANESLAHTAVTLGGGAATCDCSKGNSFSFTVSAITSIVFTNVPAGLFSVLLKITNGAAFATTFAVTPKTHLGLGVPTLSASSTDYLGLVSYDGGTSWVLLGSLIGAA